MTSDQLKDEVVRRVLSSCMPWADDQQQQKLENILRMVLYRLTLAKEETALSTEIRIPNEEFLKQFLAIKMVKGLSKNSLKLYSMTVRRLFLYVDKPVPDMTSNDIRYYLAIRKTKDGLSNTTLGSELRNLRSFFGTLHTEEFVNHNPTAKIDRIKAEKRQKDPFSEMEVELLRKAAISPKTPLENPKRNLAIIETLYSTGCRVGELVTMKRSDISGERTKVIGKGNKERYVYLNPRALIAINDYLSSRTDSYDWLFPGGEFADKSGKAVDKPLDKGTVGRMLRQIGKRAGVENCHPHRFRRTAATIALRRGMPIEQVSRMLGHEQLATTQIYAITADEDVQNSHRKYLT